MKLQIILQDKTLYATLNDSQASREFAALLPPYATAKGLCR
ncbi:hypothetical protein AAHB66_18080 [Leclercia sp. S52]